MSFTCFRPSGNCEWHSIKGFVDYYNAQFNTKYELSKCLDVMDRDNRQPEVLLASSGCPDMVVERKLMVWPLDYYKYHRTEHDFGNHLSAIIGDAFRASLFCLEINVVHLRGNKQHIKGFAEDIARDVLANRDYILATGKYAAKSPFPWYIRRAYEDERNSEVQDNGIIINFNELGAEDEYEEWVQAHPMIKDKLEGVLENARLKFLTHGNCLRVLLIELCGDGIALNPGVINELVGEVVVPAEIDQIWLFEPDYVSDDDWVPSFTKVWDGTLVKQRI